MTGLVPDAPAGVRAYVVDEVPPPGRSLCVQWDPVVGRHRVGPQVVGHEIYAIAEEGPGAFGPHMVPDDGAHMTVEAGVWSTKIVLPVVRQVWMVTVRVRAVGEHGKSEWSDPVSTRCEPVEPKWRKA